MPTEYGVRPYANMVDENNEETPYVDMMKAPTWAYALAQEVQKFSEFMKPYLSPGDYPDMENSYPTYSLDNPNPGDSISPGPLYPVGVGNPDKGKFQDCDCCFDVIWEDCADDSRSGGRFAVVFSKYPYNPATHRWIIEGAYKDVIRTPPIGTGWGSFYDSILFKFDPAKISANGFSYVDLTYQILGICSHKVEMWAPCSCCLQGPETAFSFDDDSTADTIDRETTITIYTLGGCPNYTWSVSGTGFTLGSATTAGNTNSLSASVTACGTATITVTDDCGTALTAYIRCTEGTWASSGEGVYYSHNHSTSQCASGLLCVTGCSPDIISGKDKWDLTADNTAFCGTMTVNEFLRVGDNVPCVVGTTCPPCLTPDGCNTCVAACCGGAGGNKCVTSSYVHQIWDCA